MFVYIGTNCKNMHIYLDTLELNEQIREYILITQN